MRDSQERLSPVLIAVMATAIGVIVADLYYLQPLLHQVRSDFAISTSSTSLLVTLIQVGYVIGLFFVLPLGDLFVRRTLITSVFVVAASAMALASVVHSFSLFALVTVVVGLSSVAGQIIIPFGADLAPDAQRGRVLGRLMTGLLGGILLSRTLAGALAEALGWRGVYRVGAGLLLAMAVVLYVSLPVERARNRFEYRELVTGGLRLMRSSALLRQRGWYGACAFGAFSVLWSTLAFHLSAAPFHYSSGVIGLFGLLGMSGIVAANVSGRLADQGRTTLATASAAALIPLAFITMWVFPTSLAALVVGVVVLDAGSQGVHVANQSIIYALAPTQRSTINSIYMVCFFTGASTGSLLAGLAYAHWGWDGTCAAGLLFGLGAVTPTLWSRDAAAAPSTSVR